MSDAEDLYRVVFAGNLTGDYSLERTKARFGKVFRLTPVKVERIFNGKDIILKSNVAEDKAMDFAVKLAEIGCETYIELVPGEDGQDEERRTTIRRIRFRRPPGQVPLCLTGDYSSVVGIQTLKHCRRRVIFPALLWARNPSKYNQNE